MPLQYRLEWGGGGAEGQLCAADLVSSVLRCCGRDVMRAVISVMVVALGSSICLPGPAVTRECGTGEGRGGCAVHRQSFRQLLQEISLNHCHATDGRPSSSRWPWYLAHVIIDAAFYSASVWCLCSLCQPRKQRLLKTLDESQSWWPTFAQACVVWSRNTRFL